MPRVEAQIAQKAIVKSVQENKDKEFDMAKCTKTNSGSLRKSQTGRPRTQRKCQYCGTVHDVRRFLILRRSCLVYGCQNHFKKACRNPTGTVPQEKPKE